MTQKLRGKAKVESFHVQSLLSILIPLSSMFFYSALSVGVSKTALMTLYDNYLAKASGVRCAYVYAYRLVYW